MGLLDKITGKDEEASKPKAAKKSSKKSAATVEGENVLDMVQESEATDAKSPVLKTDTGTAHRVLHNYHLSEKSNLLSTTGRYVFKVAKKANKLEVKKAIEKVYDVHVTGVNIVNTKGKGRRYGKTSGRTSDWKKAYVTLKSGEKISGLSEGI